MNLVSGWTRGSGASWLHDGGAFVQKSIEAERPVIMVTPKYALFRTTPIVWLTMSTPSVSYRIGLFGTAASPTLQEDNESAGDKGVGNYGKPTRSFPISSPHSSARPRPP
jgi:hypothetical protein